MYKLFYVLSRQAIKNILFQDMTGPGGIKKRISSGPFAHRKKTEKMIRNPVNLQDQNVLWFSERCYSHLISKTFQFSENTSFLPKVDEKGISVVIAFQSSVQTLHWNNCFHATINI